MSTSTAIALFVYLIVTFSGITSARPLSRFSHKALPLHYRTATRAPDRGTLSSRLLHYLEPRARRLQRRGLPGAVYICTDQNFRGDCSWIAPNTDCHISGTGEFAPESIGPDPGGRCILYKTATCTGAEVETLRFPGRSTNMPAFMGLKCFPDGQSAAAANATFSLGSAAASDILREADPRLPGGFGSLESKQLSKVLDDMEKDGFKEGLIGLKKDHYY